MKKLRPLALLCAGPVSRSPLTRLPNLRRNLTWVKSSSFRVASRAVNALGAGSAVDDITEMKRAALWVVSVPVGDLRSAVDELRHADVDWSTRTLLILSAEAESETGCWFREQGASVATFAPIDTEESRFVVEGDPDAVRVVRSLVEDTRARRVIEIRKGAKGAYLAGALTATQEVLPLIADAVECFQSAGISNPEAKSITEALLTGAMRSYFRAGRRAIKS